LSQIKQTNDKLTVKAMENRGLKFIESVVDQATQVKLTELMAEYFLSVMLKDKAGAFINRIFMLRAQVILLLALIKIIRMASKVVNVRNKLPRFKL
jgi:hypothetical protein